MSCIFHYQPLAGHASCGNVEIQMSAVRNKKGEEKRCVDSCVDLALFWLQTADSCISTFSQNTTIADFDCKLILVWYAIYKIWKWKEVNVLFILGGTLVTVMILANDIIQWILWKRMFFIFLMCMVYFFPPIKLNK